MPGTRVVNTPSPEGSTPQGNPEQNAQPAEKPQTPEQDAGREAMIPKQRFDEINERMKAAEQQLRDAEPLVNFAQQLADDPDLVELVQGHMESKRNEQQPNNEGNRRQGEQRPPKPLDREPIIQALSHEVGSLRERLDAPAACDDLDFVDWRKDEKEIRTRMRQEANSYPTFRSAAVALETERARAELARLKSEAEKQGAGAAAERGDVATPQGTPEELTDLFKRAQRGDRRALGRYLAKKPGMNLGDFTKL